MTEICPSMSSDLPPSDPVNPLRLPFDSMGPSIDFEVTLRYSDMDLFGHVNNAKYFSFLEEARIAWFEACVPEKWDFEKHGVLVVRNEMDYIKPVKPNDRLVIRVGASGMGNTSINVKYEGFVIKGGREDNTELAFRGATTLVSWDTEAGKVCRVHEPWRKTISGG